MLGCAATSRGFTIFGEGSVLFFVPYGHHIDCRNGYFALVLDLPIDFIIK